MADQIVNAAVMAAIFGVTERRLRQYSTQGMPKAGREGYPLAGCVRWIIEYWRTRATQTPLGDARRRKVEADASNAEIDLQLRRGAVVEVKALALAHGAVCARIKTRLQAVPSKTAPLLFRLKTVAEVEAVIRQEIDEALEELADNVTKAKAPRPRRSRGTGTGALGA